MLAQLGHAAGESASWWTAEQSAEIIADRLLASEDKPEDTPVWTKDDVRESLDPLVGYCHKAFWPMLPDDTHIVVLAARDEAHLIEIHGKLSAQPYPFPKHTLITEPDAPYNGAATAIGIYPTRDRKALRQALSTLPLLK